jgi:hypothetical protein
VVTTLAGTVYVRIGNIFDGVWTEPFETAYILMYDGKIFKVTTQEFKRVGIDRWLLLDYFNKNGYTAMDMVLIVHNHFENPRFSSNDIQSYRMLRDGGFTGAFVLYHVPSGKYFRIRDGLNGR